MTQASRQAVRTKIGPLDVIDFPIESPEAVVVCCHGYGADASDLAPLALEIPTQRIVRWIFPEAPEPLGSNPMAGGRQWFPIDEEALLQAQVLGTYRDFAKTRPPGIGEAGEAVSALVHETGVKKFVLGGFSQGSMVAIESALAGEGAPRGVFVLSGNLVDGEGTVARAAKRGGTPFFQTHGEQDPILGFDGAKQLEKVLLGAGWKGSLRPFQGGHGIAPDALGALGNFIDSVLEDSDG